MGAMGVMALALSVVGGAIGAGLGVGALSGMWGIPAVVAVATVGVVTVGVVGGGAGGGRGSVAACSAPADSACAPAAAGVPVVIPVVNDWPNDCGDNGAVAAAAHQKLCEVYKLAAQAVRIDTHGGDRALAGVATVNGALGWTAVRRARQCHD
ncbi:Conserved exported protein of uncharacterised function [Mycobacterium tuberculosis]|nr:Conserved exported protein of uncharacterised function [Mycobacterium tuberculosis]